VYRYGDEFEPLAKQIEDWRDTTQILRPVQLVEKLLVESGLYDYYRDDNNRLQNLKRLVITFQERDEQMLAPDTALRNLLEFTALAKNLDQISSDNNQVPIITIHQAKGLEFDTVFIAGVSEGEIPSYFSVRDGKLEEEKRLFYVAITRAKKHLFISAHEKTDWGKFTNHSRFINLIPQKYIAPIEISITSGASYTMLS
jgi:DNA helicase II / ATP-dependent DNA helicase PcrA